MNTGTGNLVLQSQIDQMLPEEKENYVPVIRDLTVKEEADMQIKKYSPCACGSGLSFKFCCYKK